MFPCVICRFLRCLICWYMSKDVKSLRGLWLYFPTMRFSWAVCGMHSRMYLSPLCVLSVGLSDLFMAVFPGFYLTCFWVCASGSVICTLFVGSPQIWGLWFVCRCLLQDAMFMNGLWVVFCRILCLWSVWGCVLVCEVSDLFLCIFPSMLSL